MMLVIPTFSGRASVRKKNSNSSVFAKKHFFNSLIEGSNEVFLVQTALDEDYV